MNSDNHDELMGTKCFCGNRKKSEASVCFSRCWRRLPKRMKDALYNSSGYDEALATAKKFLRARMETLGGM